MFHEGFHRFWNFVKFSGRPLQEDTFEQFHIKRIKRFLSDNLVMALTAQSQAPMAESYSRLKISTVLTTVRDFNEISSERLIKVYELTWSKGQSRKGGREQMKEKGKVGKECG